MAQSNSSFELPRMFGRGKVSGNTGIDTNHDSGAGHNVFHLPKLDKIATDIGTHSKRLLEIEHEVNDKYKEHADTQFKLNTTLDHLKEKLEAAIPTHTVTITPRVEEPSDTPDVVLPTKTPREDIE